MAETRSSPSSQYTPLASPTFALPYPATSTSSATLAGFMRPDNSSKTHTADTSSAEAIVWSWFQLARPRSTPSHTSRSSSPAATPVSWNSRALSNL